MKHLPVKDTAACEYSKTECQSAVAQALLVAAACSKGLTQACLAQRNNAEHTALDLALYNAQWFMVQLLVTAGDCAAVHYTSNRFDKFFSMRLPGVHNNFAKHAISIFAFLPLLSTHGLQSLDGL